VTERVGDWIQTFTGRQFWPLDPRADEIDIADIAHSLSMQCRYNGHCKRFYSVAEHSVQVCWSASPANKLVALLHDAGEAYLCDLPRPVKRSVTGYKEAEVVVERAIAERFGTPHPSPAEVHDLDARICLDERAQIMVTPPAPWGEPFASMKPIGVTLHCWPPEIAEKWFLHMFDVCGGKR
jgi:hypothetical protein